MAKVTKKVCREGKYKEWMPSEILTLAETHNFVDIAIKWGVSRRTLVNWAQDARKPEFCDAYRMAKDRIFKRHIDLGLSGINDRNFNSRIWEHLARVLLMEEYKMAVALPGFANASPREKIKIIFGAVERGELKTTEVKELMDSLKCAAEIEKLSEMEIRIEELEKRMGA